MIRTENLISPDISSMNNKTKDKEKLANAPKKDRNIDELLGPKENFPFLPDNHRDSGTGKFNAF